jgi:hypothetical protein
MSALDTKARALGEQADRIERAGRHLTAESSADAWKAHGLALRAATARHDEAIARALTERSNAWRRRVDLIA